MQLKSVVLPAPLGPIRPQIAPRATSNETLSSAVTPPNRIVSPRTASRAEAWRSATLSAPPTRASASSIDFPSPPRPARQGEPTAALLTFRLRLSPALLLGL